MQLINKITVHCFPLLSKIKQRCPKEPDRHLLRLWIEKDNQKLISALRGFLLPQPELTEVVKTNI